MAADRIVTIMHTPGCGAPAYFQISRDVGGGSSMDMGQIAIGEPLKSGQVLRCGSCNATMTQTQKEKDGEPYRIALTYRPYLDEVAP
jgi:hypothetical protein